MSIEEIARAAANKRYPFCGSYIPERPSFEAGYIQGVIEQKEIDDAAIKNPWISVKDRLPEDGQLIVYADNVGGGYMYGDRSYIIAAPDKIEDYKQTDCDESN